VNGIGSGPDGSANDVFFEGEPDDPKHVDGRINDALDNVSWPAGLCATSSPGTSPFARRRMTVRTRCCR
jgi:hypothetical protein